MINTLIQYLSQMGSGIDKNALVTVWQAKAASRNTQALTTAGLLISTTTTKVMTGAAISYQSVGGRLNKIALNTDMPVLVGSVTNAKFNVFCFFVNSVGTVSSAMGTEGSTLGAVKFPDFPIGQALLGFVIINPTGTGPFVGGTTALGDVTVVPTAFYISPLGSFDPSILFS